MNVPRPVRIVQWGCGQAQPPNCTKLSTPLKDGGDLRSEQALAAKKTEHSVTKHKFVSYLVGSFSIRLFLADKCMFSIR